MNKLIELLDNLALKIPKQEVFSANISKSNVGWHIEHSLLAINKVVENVKNSNPSNYKWSFKLARLAVFTMNKMPRGRGKSPKAVSPQIYDEKILNEHLKIAKLKIQDLHNISPDKYFDHPYFGNLKLKQTIKFLEIHTNHHLKIINDILKDTER